MVDLPPPILNRLTLSRIVTLQAKLAAGAGAARLATALSVDRTTPHDDPGEAAGSSRRNNHP